MDKKLYLEKIKEKDRNHENALRTGAARILFAFKGEELARQGRANIHGFGTFTVKKNKTAFIFQPR